jgi:predicted O-methyltransferase YrrM
MPSLKDRWDDAWAPLDFRDAMRKLRTLQEELTTPQQRFDVPFRFRGHRLFKKLQPRQNMEEIRALYDLVCELKPRRALEIGTARGGTLYLWTQAAADDATIVSVDLPGGDFGGAYPPCRVPFYQSFARADQHLHLIRADSHDPQTRAEVQSRFDGGLIDFAFIDGDHTYEGARADFELYGPLVRPGGIVAFHDILPRPDMPSIQVDRLWNELRDRHESRELVGSEASGRRIGIGVLMVQEHGRHVEQPVG